jgi:BirA family transcriptional regulator, biotin operon repressor / biotin---[acetyl-CoA-carboxylase] ligase
VIAGLARLLAARGGRLGRPLSIAPSTTSTNDDAKAGAKAGAPHGAVWVAETQTGGRGRQGRVWRSPPGENLLFSVLLRLGCSPARVPPLALVAGLAVRDAVANALGPEPQVLVKWPNDVVIRTDRDGRPGWRKVAGILVESSLSGAKVDHVVVGIGINVHTRAFPADLESIATSIALAARGGRALDRGEILADVLQALDRTVEHVAHRGLGLVHGRLVEHDLLAGQGVESDDGAICGVGAGIDLDGRLLVRTEDGTIQAVSSGEIRMHPRYQGS